jgi:hypothetical protein
VTRVDWVEHQRHAVVPARTLPHEEAVGFNRHHLVVVSPPDRQVIADLQALQRWDDAVGTGKTLVIDPVIAIPPSAQVADLR